MASEFLPKRCIDRYLKWIGPRRLVLVERQWQGLGLILMDCRELGDGLVDVMVDFVSER